jgi:transcription initiation factor TFIIF subunit alpha
VEKKRPVARKPVAAQKPSPSTSAAPGPPAAQPPLGQAAAQAATQDSAATVTQAPAERKSTNYGVYISKKDIEEGMRYHGFKFNVRPGADGKVPIIDPYDAGQFTRPVRLHRRYARDKQELGQPSDAPAGVDDKERELYNARRAERQAEREANQALIAPTGTSTKKTQGKKKNQKVVEDVYYNESNPKQQKAAQLRYEETKPWHMEDFESKNTWIGTYQEPMSSSSVLLTVDPEHAIFTMTPIERWYKFTQTNRLDTMTAEEAEKFMTAGYKPDRWFLKTQVGKEEEKQKQVKMKREQVMAMKKAEAAEDGGYAAVKDEGEFYNPDKDDLDFEFNDEFQDDDEGAMFGNLEEDEAKDIEKRIREEMRGANISAPGLKNTEMDFDEEEMRQKMDERAQKKREKRMKKQLIRKERKLEYEDASDSNPYSESSDDEDSDEERERLETERKEEEERKAAAANGDKSGASTKGTNTPSGRSEKKDPARSNAALAASLKRPGSPNLSDASGTESRKKAKGTNGRALTYNGRSLSRKH